MQLNKDDVAYEQKLNLINDEHKRKTAQYISEGITFRFCYIGWCCVCVPCCAQTIFAWQTTTEFYDGGNA